MPWVESSSRREGRVGVALLLALAAPASCALDAGADDAGDAAVARAGGEAGACVAGRESAQFRAEVAPPEFMLPGGRAQVSVTFDNCSGRAWDAREFALVPAPGTAGTWGVARVELPHDVPEGARVTIPFEVQAPREGGTYEYSWAVARGGDETFQSYSPVGRVTVRSAANCGDEGPVARFRAQTPPPAFVGLGEPVRGTVTFANCGAQTWSREAGVYLAPALPADQHQWGQMRVELPNDVPFGSEVTIPIEGVAPGAPGRYRWTWTLRAGDGPVGEASPEARVTALTRFDCGGAGPASRFVAQNAPGEMDASASADVSVTFANCGETVWGSDHRINAAAPATDGRWGAGNIALPLEIAPGFQVTVPFRIQAPRDGGTYPYRWVVTRGETDIHEPTPERNITVRSSAGPCTSPPIVPMRVTSPYGYRRHPIYGDWRLHTGTDFAGGSGHPLLACRAGVVVRANWYGGYGNAVVIDHGGGMSTLYAHQSRFGPGIGPGVRVNSGQVIGYVGTTGTSTAPHLHFEVRIHGTPVNPAPYL